MFKRKFIEYSLNGKIVAYNLDSIDFIAIVDGRLAFRGRFGSVELPLLDLDCDKVYKDLMLFATDDRSDTYLIQVTSKNTSKCWPV